MIDTGTVFYVGDNTGAKIARHIKKLRSNGDRSRVNIGDIIKVSILKSSANSSIPKKKVCTAVLVSSKCWEIRKNGFTVKHSGNYIVILDDNSLDMVGTRIMGFASRGIRNKGFMKIASLCSSSL